MAVIYGGFLISEKLKKVLEQYNLPVHRFYPAALCFKKQSYQYYWMHIICNLTNAVDYPESLFFVYHNYSKNMGYTDVVSREDLQFKREKIEKDNPGKTVTIWAENIKLTNDFDKTLDLFHIGSFNADYYISGRLLGEIIKEKITGCHLVQADNLLI